MNSSAAANTTATTERMEDGGWVEAPLMPGPVSGWPTATHIHSVSAVPSVRGPAVSRMGRWIWLMWIPWLAIGPGGAVGATTDPATRLTVDAAVARAVRENPDLVAARLGIEQARGRMAQAGRLGSPELGAEFRPNVAGREGSVSVGFTQRFPAAARLRAERAVSRWELLAAEAEVADAERRVAQQVRSLGIEGLALAAQQRLKDEQILNSRGLADAARRTAAAGEGSAIDTAQFELETRQLELERLRLDAQLAETMAELRSWLGWPEGSGLSLEGELPGPVVPSADRWEPERRPDYRAALARSTAARDGVSLARASRWEEVSVGLFGEVQREEDAPIGLEDEAMVGLRLSVPLPIWGRFRGRIDEAAATALRSEKEAEALAVRIRAEAEVARVRMDLAARQAVEIGSDLLPRALDLETRLRVAHQQGQATVTDVLRARERRLGLEVASLTARRDFHLARVRYEAAIGDRATGRVPAGTATRAGVERRPVPRRRRRLRSGVRGGGCRVRCDGGVGIAAAHRTDVSGVEIPPRCNHRLGELASATGAPSVVATAGRRLKRTMTRLWLAFVLLVSPGVLVAAEGSSAEPPVVLDATTIQNLRLETVTVGKRVFEETLFALGRIRVAPGRQAFVSSRVPGRALRVEAHIDTRVEKGDELVLVESRLSGDPPPTVGLRAPMSGLIASVNIALGQPVSPEAALIEIVDLDEVHAVAAVPEHLVGRLKLGNRSRLRVSALPGREFEAELAHFGAEADMTAGTLDAAFHVENPDYALRPGMRAEFSIVVHSRPDVLAVPREAIQGDMGSRSVFVRETGRTNAFVRVPVVLGAENDRQVEVLRGLKEGDEVVARGAYSLGFAGRGAVSLKASLDAAHGHDHNEDGSEKHDDEPAGTSDEAEHDHEHDHDEDPDHDHEGEVSEDRAGVGGGDGVGFGTWGIFFATTTGLLTVLLVLSVARGRAERRLDGVRAGMKEGDGHA